MTVFVTTTTSVLIAALTVACGHDAGVPGSVPIAALTHDAVFVVNGADSTISVINAESDEVAATIELTEVEYPHHIYLSADGATMLVAAPGADLSGGHTGGHGGHGGAVLVMDATTGAMRAARRLEAANHNAILSPGGAAIWTTQSGTPGQVLRLDPNTLETIGTADVGDEPSEVTFSVDGSRAFVANTGSDSVTVLDPATGTVLHTIPTGDAPVGAWPGSDGRMYVDNEAGKSLTVIDVATLTVTSTIQLGFTPAVAAVAPGGELWVTNTDDGKLAFFDATSGVMTGELVTGAGAHAIAFDPGRGKAYVINQADGTVAVVDVATKTIAKTIAVGAKPNGIVFRAK
jgi:YVTN family beta-propeller protein